MTARFSASAKTPWFTVPSPKKVIATRSVRSICAESAAPTAMGMPAPTMAFSPSRPTDGSVKCIEPPFPLLHPVRLPSSSAIASLGSSPLAMAWPWPR